MSDNWRPSLHAIREIPARIEPIHLFSESRYDPTMLTVALTVRNTVVNGEITRVEQRTVSYEDGMFTPGERMRLARLLGAFVAEARGGKLA